eukprot:5544812-Amphidinium_carterae.1
MRGRGALWSSYRLRRHSSVEIELGCPRPPRLKAWFGSFDLTWLKTWQHQPKKPQHTTVLMELLPCLLLNTSSRGV